VSNDRLSVLVSAARTELRRDTQPQAVGNCRYAFSPGGQSPER